MDRATPHPFSLRNVALTGPWWHGGSARSLEEAIHRHGRVHAPDQIAELLAFLGSLTDPEFITRKNLSTPDPACGR